MGKYVNNGIVSIPAEHKFGSIEDILVELGALLGVGARSNGRRYVADMEWGNVNKWAKQKWIYDSTPMFETDSERFTARYNDNFGLSASASLLTNNAYVSLVSWSRKRLPADYPKRIHDMDGYNHYAKDGVNIKGASSATITTTLTLQTEAEEGDNYTLRDAITHLYDHTYFQWVLIDAFGFIHELHTNRYSQSEILDYLYGTSTKLTVRVQDFAVSTYNRYDAIAAPSSILGFVTPKWTLGLMAWTNSSERFILNPVQFPDLRIHSAPITVTGFTANMTIGTAYMGRTTLRSHLYDGTQIQCCSDDYLFMGFVVKNVGTSAFNMSKLRLLFITNVSSVRPYATNVAIYNQSIFNYSLPVNGTLGSGGGIATAWANGMMFIRTTNLWSISPQGFAALAYVGSSTNIILLTPYIPLALINKNVTVASIADNLKATLPDVKPVDNSWSTTIQ